ncbi:MAG: hypothetical protein NTX33_08605 [Propionibacteriales bacterium]|nr:hypothetical protein [Propionibacteriales bacterium]
MRTQNLVFTPLPNGRTSDNRLRLSVHVSMRLETDADGPAPTLQAFQDVMFWGTTANRATFSADFGTGTLQPAEIVSGGADVLLWNTIFTSSCPVKPFGFSSFEGRKLRSFPASNVRTYLRGLYSSFGLANQFDFPSSKALLAGNALGSFAAIDPDDPVHTRLLDKVQDLFGTGTFIPPKNYALSDVGSDLTQVEILHRPRPKGAPVPAPKRPDFDFHQGIAALAAHPGLLRRLGLVFDLLIPLPPGYTNLSTVSVVPTLNNLAFRIPTGPTDQPMNRTRVVSPRIRFVPAAFKAAPRAMDPLFAGGRLNLADSRYVVSDVDLDGAALKLLSTASTVKRSAASEWSSPSSPDTQPLPALRSEGIVLFQTGKAASLRAEMTRQRTLNLALATGQSPILEAEDVTRGYYLDIWDDTVKKWSPLCMRSVTYRAPGRPVFTIDDEGAVSLAVTSDGQGAPLPDVMVPEVLAKWSGWSAVAPRIGRQLARDNSGLVDPVSTANETAIKVGIETSVPRPSANLPGLPRLRFGRAYRVRARAADLAGNGEVFTNNATDARASTALTLYNRYEPVPPPVVLKREDATPASSVLRMVIRSDYDQIPGNAVATYRHLVTPNAGQLMVEQCGALNDGRSPAELYEVLQQRDGQLLNNPDANRLHPDESSPLNAAGAQELVYPDAFVTIPYLPDPLSRGVVFYGLPFGVTTVATQKIPGGTARMAWNVTGGFETVVANRIRLVEPRNVTTAAAYQHVVSTIGRNQELTVYLPKASVVRTSLRSFLGTGGVGPTSDVDRMGIWQWLLQAAPGYGLSTTQISDLKKRVAAGLHWMITPSIEIELVHAVRRPLLRPTWQVSQATRTDATGAEVSGSFAMLSENREPGETATVLTAAILASGRSTGRINVIANWKEWIDPVDEPGPRQQTLAALPCSFPVNHLDQVAYPVASASGVPTGVTRDPLDRQEGTHELHDTRHRMISYSLEAVSPFVEEFGEENAFNFPPWRTIQLADVAIVSGHTTIIDAADGTTYEEGRDFTINSPSPGQVSLTTDSDIPTGRQMIARFVRGPISRFSTEVPASEATTTTINILATARPAAPQIEYVLPAYQWGRWVTSASQDTNKRTGNLLRVWLGRPWFSSGDGEELAVICPPGTVQPDAMTPLHSYVSLIGMDPVWGDTKWSGKSGLSTLNSPGIATRKILKPVNFSLATRKLATGLRVPELGATDLGAAVHVPKYDAERQLWYCDIAIDSTDQTPEPYTPFVQLALARFQANSIVDPLGSAGGVDLRLSPIVLAELAQLAPDRSLTILKTSGRLTSVKITGTSYRTNPAEYKRDVDRSDNVGSDPGPALMVCQVQTVGPGMNPTDFPDTAWINEGLPQVMKSSVSTAGVATWTVVPTVPTTSAPVRLVFTEYEEYSVGAVPEQPVKGRVAFVATYRIR